MAHDLKLLAESGETSNGSRHLQDILECLWRAQYLELRCRGLTYVGLNDLVTAINVLKKSRTQDAGEPDCFNLVVTSVIEEQHRKYGKRVGVVTPMKQWVSDQCKTLEECIVPSLSCLGYLLIYFVDGTDSPKGRYYLRKSHKGKIFHSFKDDSTRRRFPSEKLYGF